MTPNKCTPTEVIKETRKQVDATINAISTLHRTDDVTPDHNEYLYSLAQNEAFRAATEAKMWLGKMLEAKGNPFPAELADKAE